MSKKFNERLKELRINSNLSQGKLGDMLNLNQRTISHYEIGIYEPTIDVVIKIASIFNVSTDYLLGLTDIKKPFPNE